MFDQEKLIVSTRTQLLPNNKRTPIIFSTVKIQIDAHNFKLINKIFVLDLNHSQCDLRAEQDPMKDYQINSDFSGFYRFLRKCVGLEIS